ncbi:melanocyte-stimulating hormone receptor-like [Orbicella faveolata]|uniref:melanocyte-stimulating hormone receptor-like n=1 Tax=Orbicella faveolata TaxID=48498 RepID=UPI0009E4DFAE|nr:melanocyte-stimulating hormone receptor-like [Orbicella faveolata]
MQIMPNFSRETTPMLFCSRHWDGESYLLHIYSSVVFFCVILTITATLGNSLILFALHKDKSLHPPSKLLLRCLTVTDLCVGVIGQPTAITLLLSAINENWKLCRVAKYLAYVTTTISSGVSLATLTAISVDRLLALLLGLRYRQVVTVKRVRTIIILFWLKSSAVGILYVWDMTAYFITSAVLVMLQVIISTYSYARIFRTIRRQQTQVQDTLGGQSGSISPNMARYKKTVINALWVHLTLATCYLPFAVVMTVAARRGLDSSLFLAEDVAVNFVYLNSSLNPILYCWKIKEVRQAVKETLRQFWACLST